MEFKDFVKLLEDNGVEVTDDLREEMKKNYPEVIDTDDLFTQEDVNKIVSKRLSREQKLHDQEIQELKDEMKGLVDPKKVKEYETKIEELEGKAKERETELKKQYELQLAAADAGVSDQEYFEFLTEKKGFKDRLTVDDDGNVVALDEDGDPIKDDGGNKVGPEGLIVELKEEKPEVFGKETKKKKKSTGPTNPKTGAELTEEEKKERSKNFAAELGYANKEDKE